VNPREIHGLLVVAKSKNAQLWRSHFLVFLYGKLATTLFPQNSTSIKKGVVEDSMPYLQASRIISGTHLMEL
jgi:hypothetical protein